MKVHKIWKHLVFFNLNSLQLNFKYLPWHQAIKFPILASNGVKLRIMEGKVIINAPLKPGLIKIGTGEIGIYDKRHNRAIWENKGTVIFNGEAIIKYGAKIVVGEQGILELGDRFRITSGSSIVCYKHIKLGNNCRISWDAQIIDTDFHSIFDNQGNKINPNKSITIDDDCWIGNRCTISKGTILPKHTVIASNSLINKEFLESNTIIGGTPGKVIKRGITWGE
jgi:acetyltransferase-like isoleucine patch superfamily enzyme